VRYGAYETSEVVEDIEKGERGPDKNGLPENLGRGALGNRSRRVDRDKREKRQRRLCVLVESGKETADPKKKCGKTGRIGTVVTSVDSRKKQHSRYVSKSELFER